MASTRDRALRRRARARGRRRASAHSPTPASTSAQDCPRGRPRTGSAPGTHSSSGVVAWLAESERADLAGAQPSRDRDARAAHRRAQRRASPSRRGRFAVTHAGALRAVPRRARRLAELLAPLLRAARGVSSRGRRRSWRASARAHPRRPRARSWPPATASCCTGVTVDPDAEIRPVIDRVVRACLGRSDPPRPADIQSALTAGRVQRRCRCRPAHAHRRAHRCGSAP